MGVKVARASYTVSVPFARIESSVIKTLSTISLGLAGWSTIVLLAQTPSGSTLFKRDCATCHKAGDNRAPLPQTLRGLSADAVLTALTTGKMTVQAQRLTQADRIAVAEFV